MNRERFIALVKNPALLKSEDAPFLEELLREYPFFQTAHLLAARCYKVSDSIHLQKQIKTAAAHIIDRNVLYNLIENFDAHYSLKESKESASDDVKSQEKALSVQEPVNERHDETPQQIPEVTLADEVISMTTPVEHPEVVLTDEAEARNEVNSENPILEAEIPQVIPEKFEAPTDANLDLNPVHEAEIPLEREIKLALAESIYLQEFEHESDEIVQKEVEPETLKPNNEEKTAIAGQKLTSETKEVKEHAEEPEMTPFVAWLKKLQLQAPEGPTTQENNTAQEPIKKSDHLVTSFMEKPVQRIKPSKQEFYSPVNMAKQSVTDNDFFVTETLAKIYIKQGNLAKAIKVYQNLSLKNPEKNTFFAAQIKILKEQLHNKSGK